MDQGIAGLLAGVAGLVGAGIGGLATAYGARIGAVKTIEAAQTQVDRQAKVEHEHWVRDQRKQAYSDFLEAHSAVAAANTRCRDRLVAGASAPPEDIASLREPIEALASVFARIQLWGPTEMVTKAQDLTLSAAVRFGSQVDWSTAIARDEPTEVQESRMTDYESKNAAEGRARIDFANTARATLEAPN